MKIINLTQHAATPEQRDAGVVDITDETMKKELVRQLTFDEIPTQHWIVIGEPRPISVTVKKTSNVGNISCEEYTIHLQVAHE